jgi:hypothetical protein
MEKLMKGMSKGKMPDLGAVGGQAPAQMAGGAQPRTRKATKSNKRKKRQKSRR